MNDKPKELEEHSAQIFELGCMERTVYMKEDVDAVIAGIKQKLQDQCISCPVKMQEDDVVAEKDKQLRHHKYKRCLAMARWFKIMSILAADYRVPREKWNFYEKWHNRWLELSEKFKEAK